MKKIISLVCVIAMLFAFAVTASAAATGSMVFSTEKTEVTVGEDFYVTIMYVPGPDSYFKGGTVKLDFNDTLATFVEETASDVGDGVFATNMITNKPANHLYAVKHAANTEQWQDKSEEAVFSVMKFNAVAPGTFTVASAATGTSVTFSDAANTSTGRLTVKTVENPVTITIKAAEPKYEEMTGEASLDHTSIEAADGTVWNEVAVYSAEFNLSTIVAAKGYGLEIEGVKNPITINGSGVINTIFALYGVADANALDVNTYYWVAQ